jgi:hypothetical protein
LRASPAGFPAAASIRKTLSLVQVCGLDNSVTEEPQVRLPLVVAIGANYTQGSNEVPRDMHPSFGTEEDLTKWRNLAHVGLGHYAANQRCWYDASVASSDSISIPSSYRFLMTNFCLWITEDSWPNIRPSRRADLLAHNPPTGTGNSTGMGSWWHLRELAKMLNSHGVQTIWVGHGTDCEVFALFRQFMLELDQPDWLLLPNVSRPYGYENKTARHLRPELAHP